MIGFRENEEKNCIFSAPPLPPPPNDVALFKVSQSERAYFAMNIIP